MILVGPLFGIDGADALILKATENPEGLKKNMNEVNALKLIQLFSTIGTFLIPALIFGFTKSSGFDFLKLKTKTTGLIILSGMAAIFLSAPLVNEIYNLNKLIDPEWFGSIGKGFIESEED